MNIFLRVLLAIYAFFMAILSIVVMVVSISSSTFDLINTYMNNYIYGLDIYVFVLQVFLKHNCHDGQMPAVFRIVFISMHFSYYILTKNLLEFINLKDKLNLFH